MTNRLSARIAVGVARLAILLPPPQLLRFVELVSRGARPADPAIAAEARDVVCAVSRRCAGQGCLQRSVAVVLLCRARGVAPDWCTGFLTRPFTAHAWVEADGRPVGEKEQVSEYVVVQAHRVPAR
ncbi:lasso peptide biosynthesis B2 protein [Actinoplanes sp. NPDC051861]|uniref:lasso peptide biosynthesis B2 protein n=1 Tax=Actinoplanes sp. NPDC051861 TaxID=3155170 RepID=UPI003428DE06